MKLYVVESTGEDSQYGCYGVFSSMQKAEEFVEAECISNPDLADGRLCIEEVNLDNIEPESEYNLDARLREYDLKREDT